MPKRIDITGKRFGRLIVLGYSHTNTKRKSVWKVKCDCGKEKTMTRGALMIGAQSCGCYMKEKNSLPTGISTMNKIFYVYKRNATRRGIEFELSRESFVKLATLDCFYCGTPPKNVMKSQYANGDTLYNGIDRVNNNIGYIESNCVPCCSNCNYAKRKMNVGDFFSWACSVVNKSIRSLEKFGGKHASLVNT